MTNLFLKYYFDITKINLLVTLVIGFFSSFIICFGTFGTLISFMIYSYFQKEQYYFYLNQGFTKLELMRKTFLLNFLIATVLFVIFR